MLRLFVMSLFYLAHWVCPSAIETLTPAILSYTGTNFPASTKSTLSTSASVSSNPRTSRSGTGAKSRPRETRKLRLARSCSSLIKKLW